MRILHVVAKSQRRGAEMVALELSHELDALGHSNRVVALGLAPHGGSDPDLPVLAERAGEGARELAGSVWRLRRLLRADPVDVILAHGGWALQVAALARPRRGTVVVWQRILGFPPEMRSPARRRWWRAILGRTDAAVALTNDLADELRDLDFDGPIWVIANMRRPERFVGVDRGEANTRMRRAIGLDDDVPLLGFVGHLVDQKRPERAVEVLDRVLAHDQPAHLVVVGDGPLRSRVEHEALSRGVADHVTMLGHRADVEQVLGAIDVVLLTSDMEGIPGVAIEAQMAGCPVVTFPLGGVSEVVDHGRTGLVLDRPDTALMAEETLHLLRRPELRSRLGVEARRRAHDFSASRAAEEYASCFADLLARGHDRAR